MELPNCRKLGKTDIRIFGNLDMRISRFQKKSGFPGFSDIRQSGLRLKTLVGVQVLNGFEAMVAILLNGALLNRALLFSFFVYDGTGLPVCLVAYMWFPRIRISRFLAVPRIGVYRYPDVSSHGIRNPTSEESAKSESESEESGRLGQTRKLRIIPQDRNPNPRSPETT